MKLPSPAQTEMARRLLALEGAGGSALECAAAAGRIYDNLQGHLAPLVGAPGVHLLFARSAKLGEGKLAAFAEAPIHESSTKLRECLQAQDLVVATESAVALFGTFFALLTTFIGERLTAQLLRRAWPTIEEMVPKETRE